MNLRQRRQVTAWLSVSIVFVFAMVILGGSVRLTGSGLSMVEWQPLMGIFPPLNQVAWLHVFEQYKNYPEYQLVNQGMDLQRFKFIFYMEYFHRLLGRLVGLVFFIPFVLFLARDFLPRWLKARLWIALLLGACQGLMGWYMVKSGLVNDPHVSQYRLTAHLLLAVLIYAWLLQTLFKVLLSDDTLLSVHRSLLIQGRVVVALILLMIISGGFMAGTKAGFIYNTWPTMSGQVVPQMLGGLVPWWRNLFENTITIQFIHRWLAFMVLFAITGYGIAVIRARIKASVNKLAGLAILLVCCQVVLGIFTLINKVPIAAGVAHQGMALLVLGAVITVHSHFVVRKSQIE